MAQEEEKYTCQKSLFAPLPETNRGYCLQLDGSKKAKKFLYTNGRHVVVRSLEDPNVAELFSEHKHKVNVARFSPNGEWVASGDERGKVLIWALNSQRIKLEVQVCRNVMDLAWSDCGQKILAVGDGAESFAKVFTWDSGNNIGEITGHAKKLITCDYKKTRPFRLITGAEDNAVNTYAGPPFKLQTNLHDHTRYPNCVRYSPDGTKAISVGADRQIIVYDAKEGNKLNEFGLGADKAHTMSILSFSWSPDSKSILTCSMDRSARLWDVETGTVKHVWEFGAERDVPNQQVGTLWVDGYVMTVGLNGLIHFLNVENGTVIKTIHGHQVNVTGMGVDETARQLWTSGADGCIIHWNLADGSHAQYGGGSGNAHNACIADLAFNRMSGQIHTVGLDDMLRCNGAHTPVFTGSNAALGGQPVKVATGNASNVTASALVTKKLVFVRDGAVVQTIDTDYEVASLCFSPDDKTLLVGCSDNAVRFFNVGAVGLEPNGDISRHEGAVTALAFSPDGSKFATGGRDRAIFFYDTATRALQNDGWQLHTSTVTGIAFTSDNSRMVSSSLDQSVIIWYDMKDKAKNNAIQFVHIGGVDRLHMLSDSMFVTTGQDRTIRTWEIPPYK